MMASSDFCPGFPFRRFGPLRQTVPRSLAQEVRGYPPAPETEISAGLIRAVLLRLNQQA
jgi:hypothetical protein